MSSVSVKITGAKELQKKFVKLSVYANKKKPLYKRISIQLLNEISKTFKEETHEEKPWGELSKATKKARRKGKGKNKEPKILQDTGHLRRSFVGDATSQLARVGTVIKYSEYHEDGTEKIPQRKMLPSDERAMEIAVETTDKYIDNQIKKLRLK